MKFYNRYYKNNYEELLTYYPRFYREVLEMKAILKTQGEIADSIENNIEQIFNNCFIDEADEATILKHEIFLGIEFKPDSLEERKRLVKSYYIGFGKISASMIKGIVQSYIDVPVNVCFEPFDDKGNNRLFIDLERDCDAEAIYVKNILPILARKIPAHIKWVTNISYFLFVLILERINIVNVLFITFMEAVREKMSTANVSFFFDALLKENFEDTTVVIRRNLWFLNGAVQLDGSRLLNAAVWEEDIE